MDCERAYLLVKGQYSPNMIAELKYHDEYDDIQDGFNLVKLLKLIKKICYNYKTQDHVLQAIVNATITYYSTIQKYNESIKDYTLAFENGLTIYNAVGGTVLNEGVTTYVAQTLFRKTYSNLTVNRKKTCDATAEERVTIMVLFGNTDRKRFGKLQDEMHDDHLKNQNTYPTTVAGATRLLTNHSKGRETTTLTKRYRGYICTR